VLSLRFIAEVYHVEELDRGMEVFCPQYNSLLCYISVIEQVPVAVSIVFAKINGIDTIKDRFVADVQVQLKWREPLLDNKQLVNN
jgi:hypothetical protein